MRELLVAAVPARAVAVRVFAALAAVALAADEVHRHRERLVRLRRQRAVRHRAGGEPARDLTRPARPRRAARSRPPARARAGRAAPTTGRSSTSLAELVVEVVAALVDRALQHVRGAHVGRIGVGCGVDLLVGPRKMTLPWSSAGAEGIESNLLACFFARLPLLVVVGRSDAAHPMQRVEHVGVVRVVLAATLAEPDQTRLVERDLVGTEAGRVPREHVGAELRRSRCRRRSTWCRAGTGRPPRARGRGPRRSARRGTRRRWRSPSSRRSSARRLRARPGAWPGLPTTWSSPS